MEHILASHPQVYGAGELETLKRLVTSFFDKAISVDFPESVCRAEGGAFKGLGEKYIRELRRFSGEARFITDKMPVNYIHIGLIKLALPNAKIIHCRRDPADNGLSLFKTFFSQNSYFYAYANDLSEIGHHYGYYHALMEHWNSVLPGFVHDLQYEDMVSDQAGRTKSLLEHCGLEWDGACLEFHKTERPVQTASATQVRQPIYKDSVQSWKKYEKHLAPLLETLPETAGSGGYGYSKTRSP